MSHYRFEFEGVEKVVQPGWSMQQTANGRNRLQCKVLSIDGSFRPAMSDDLGLFEQVFIVSSSVANPTVVTTAEPHGILSGQTVGIGGHTSTPSLNAYHTATVLSPTTFTVPVNVTVGGGATGWVARSIFGGEVLTPRETGLGGYGVQPILTHVSAVSMDARTERRYVKEVLLAGTLKSQLTTLVANYLPLNTLHPAQVDGPAMPDIPCDYALLRNVLDLMGDLSGGYVWEIDTFGLVRMFLPASEPAPFNIANGDGNTDGDIEVEPTRNGYANRVVLRFTAAAISAYAFLYPTSNFGNGETVIIGSRTYTFQTTLTDSDGNVKIGASAVGSLENLIAAITLGSGAGTNYATSMTENTSVTAYMQTFDPYMAVRALTPGASGNSIGVSETAANASWITEGGGPTSTLLFGADEALTNVAIAEDASFATDPWEVVIEAPDITSQSLADTTVAAYLANHLITPKKVKYDTYKLGLLPGQSQTINITNRNVNNTFLITEINIVNTVPGNLIKRTVIAIESLIVNAAPRWRDTYRQWSGTISSSGTSVSASGGGGGGGGSAVPIIYPFGGSQIEWVRSPTPTWVAANSVQIRIDTTVRGSLTGTCYVRLRARSGSVTARLRNLTDGATVGTSAVVSNVNFETVSFAVLLTAGAKYYGLELLPSLANVDVQAGSAYME